MKLRLIGDIHGNTGALLGLLHDLNDPSNDDYVIQIGDFGIGFGAEKELGFFNPAQLGILAGNHDNYAILENYMHNLGRFGVKEIGGKKIFFVSGAWSIDYAWRTPGVSWWPYEELSMEECEQCLQLWERHCSEIDLVISHDGPLNATSLILGSWPHETNTGRLLWEMWKTYEPREWRFGHWHVCWQKQIGDTHFRCLNIEEEEVIDLEKL